MKKSQQEGEKSLRTNVLRKPSSVPALPGVMPVPVQKHRWRNQNCLGMKEGLKPSLESEE